MSKPSLRDRNRLATMRTVQAAAMDMFEVDGYSATTVEGIAAESGVSPSTVYRHFGTKESLVLWDERDPIVESELTARLGRSAGRRRSGGPATGIGREPAVAAVAEALVVALAERDDLDLFARRMRLAYSDPSIGAAAIEDDLRDRHELAEAFAQVGGSSKPSIADEVTAAACLAALDVAVNHWQRSASRADLADLIREAFSALDPGDH